MMDDTPVWLHALRDELDAMSDLEQINATGAWITLMTNELLTELSKRRQILVAQVLLRPGWDPTRLAETIGSRRTAIARLGELGRRIMREEGLAHAVEEEEGAGEGTAGEGEAVPAG